MSRMGIILVGLCLDDNSWMVILIFFWNIRVKYGSDPSTPKANAFSAQDDQLGRIMLDRC